MNSSIALFTLSTYSGLTKAFLLITLDTVPTDTPALHAQIEEKDDEEEPGEAIDDLDELLSRQPKKKRGHMEKDDTFQVDFIDLD